MRPARRPRRSFSSTFEKPGLTSNSTYQQGRHGFGLGEGHPVLSDWPGRCENWLKNLGILADPAKVKN
jgi:hypothetical protein